MNPTTKATPDQNELRAALAAQSYARDEVRVADADLAGYDWLVSSSKGVFAVNDSGFKTVIFGWFFGICRYEDRLFLFENCGHKQRELPRGRLVQMRLRDGRLSDATVLATGLDCRCHQIAVIDGLLHVLDTANQAVVRYDLDGKPVDVVRPFQPATGAQVTGFHHINAIAKIGPRIGIMLHNGRQIPPTISELAWFDSDWRPTGRTPMPGLGCHDIVADEQGCVWHSDSMTGDIIDSTGRRFSISQEFMTRGIAFSGDRAIIGLSNFGPRYIRGSMSGAVAICNRNMEQIAELKLPGPPADIIALQ